MNTRRSAPEATLGKTVGSCQPHRACAACSSEIDWSQYQWSLAAGWFERIMGYLPLPDFKGANEVMAKWLEFRHDSPGWGGLIAIDWPAQNSKWANRMIYNVALECLT